MAVLFLFLDGVGVGDPDPAYNPLAAAHLPALADLLEGRRWLQPAGRWVGARAAFIPADATLGVAGPPQSASGQAALLTGRNVPAELGEHWGPKPNAAIAAILQADSLFHWARRHGQRAALLNAYPPRYFQAIERGRRNHAAIPLAVTAAGCALRTLDDLRAGRALSADFTGAGWRSELGFADTPLYTPAEAGARLAGLAQAEDFAFFEYWLSDVLGHRGTLAEAVTALETLDAMLAGLLAHWDMARDTLIITSDHGNLEDLRHTHHTCNPVFAVVAGRGHQAIAHAVQDITGFYAPLTAVLGG